MTIFAAGCGATQECVGQNPGWGKLIALVLAGLLFWGITSAHTRMKTLQNDPHSPNPEAPSTGGVNAQVSDPREPVLTPRGSGDRKGDNDLDTFVSTNLERLPRNELKRQAMALFRKSESTIKRRIREAREARDGVLPDEDDES